MSESSNGRKRKVGTVVTPSDDDINNSVSASGSRKSLRLEYDDYTSSEGEDGGKKDSIKVWVYIQSRDCVTV